MTRRDIRLLSAFTLTVLAACVLAGCQRTGSEEEQDTLPKEAVPVRAVQAALRTLRPSVDLVGTLVALPECTSVVSPQVGGWIKNVAVVEGATVRAGDELVVLDTRLAEVELARAKAAVAEKEATLARLKRGYLPQEIEMARDEVGKAKESVESLRAEVAALQPLRQRKEISELQYQKVESSLRAAEAGYAGAQAKLRLLEAGTPPEEIAQAEAGLGVAQADLDAAQLNLRLCTITSPIAGTVTQLTARQGVFVERSTPLLTVVDPARLFMQVRIPSVDMAKVRAGARVDVRVTSHPGQVFPGAVARISGQADPATGDVDAFVAIPNAEGLLRPGLACRGRLWLPAIAGVLAVPVAAVADHAGTPVVTVVRDGKAHEVEVGLATRTQDYVQVVQGLSPGDWVITEGGYGLPENCPVRIVSDSPQGKSPAGAD
jgi:HlyD family secretion protein